MMGFAGAQPIPRAETESNSTRWSRERWDPVLNYYLVCRALGFPSPIEVEGELARERTER
jgi:hypothetical protein